MSVSRIGSFTEYDDSTNNASSTSISVPSNATLAVVGVTGYENTPNFFSGGTLTLGGVPMTAVPADADNSNQMAALFYLFAPPTGTQPLAYDWNGAAAPLQGVIFAYGFYQGTDAGPVRDSDGGQSGTGPYLTKSLTALPGDLIIAFSGCFASGATTWSWLGATDVADFDTSAPFAASTATVAEASPSGNQTVQATNSVSNDGGIAAIVVKPAGVVSVPNLTASRVRFF